MNENAKKWVAALRSGEFRQAMHALRDGNSFCCLGVACEVYRRETGDGEWHGIDFVLDQERGRQILPSPVRDWLGLEDNRGRWSVGSCLSQENDDGASFAKIADIIESEPAGLFRAEPQP